MFPYHDIEFLSSDLFFFHLLIMKMLSKYLVV